MKADAATKTGAPELRIPSWVPEMVAYFARGVAQRNPPAVHPELLRAVITDERMRWVWRELGKRHRDGNGYLHPVRAPKGREQDPNWQGAGMVMLFSAVIGICSEQAFGLRGVTTRKKAEADRDMYRQKAAELRALAESINSGLTDASSHPHYILAGLSPNSYRKYLAGPLHIAHRRRATTAARRLEDAAKVYDDLAQAEDKAIPAQMHRDRGNAAKRTVALRLVTVCREGFGASLFGVVANILSVLFGSEIAVSTVRHWCSHPRE